MGIVETAICNECNIRFIDARTMITEAKLNLGIEGYHDESQSQRVIDEAKKIFFSKPEDYQTKMQLRNVTMEKLRQQSRQTVLERSSTSSLPSYTSADDTQSVTSISSTIVSDNHYYPKNRRGSTGNTSSSSVSSTTSTSSSSRKGRGRFGLRFSLQ